MSLAPTTLARTIAFASLLLAVALPARAEVVFVDAANDGVGAQDGRSWATAWSTIAKGASDLRWFSVPGGVLLIRPGFYREQIDLDGRRSGAPGSPNVIRAEAPGVVIDAEKIRNECFLIDGQAAYIQIDGIVCRNARHRGFLLKQAASNLTLSNNVVFNSNDSGIELSEGAAGNAVVNNRVYTSNASGIELNAAGSGNRVANNLVYDHAESGIQVIGSGSSVIKNNTVYANHHGIRVDSPAAITNNVVAANAGVGLLELPGAAVVNDYNCVSGSGEADYQGAHTLGAHTVRTDPLFVDPRGPDGVLGGDHGADDDFHLQSLAGSYHGGAWTPDPGQSPCIDAGDPADDFRQEPENNGNRINAGSDGNTLEASRSWTGGADRVPPAGLVAVAGNSAYTNTATVRLSHVATDPSGVVQMCISNEPACTSWRPYAPTSVWTLTAGDGPKTVYARFRDGAGNVNAVPFTAAIVLDTVAPANPTAVSSTGHAVGVWSRERTVRIVWSGATDDRSGVEGYSARWDTSAASLPIATPNAVLAAISSPPLQDGAAHYFHLRTRDRAKNWTPGAVHLGPFLIDGTPPVDGQLAATPGSGQVSLAWSGFSDAASGLAPADTYRVAVQIGGAPAPRCASGTAVYVGTAQSFQHMNLVRGKPYFYRVCAVDRAGNVSIGAMRSATPR